MIHKLQELSEHNEQALKGLLAARHDLVAFIGAGFSCPVCPGWGDFLDAYFESIQREYLTGPELEHYASLKADPSPERFEKIADFLVDKGARRHFAEQLHSVFGRTCAPQQRRKFHLLHLAFPGLKITTNYDFLIEDNHPGGKHVEVARGNRPEDLERVFTKRPDNCLLKIHGDLRDMQSIVLASRQYEDLYGAARGFNSEACLPAFLKRLFTNRSVLFIGCSLQSDRVLAVLQSQSHVRPHFALMKRPNSQDEIVAINRRLSDFQIQPLWFQEYQQIPEILECLAPGPIQALKPPESIAAFVGRETELDRIRGALERNSGSIQMISGRLFNVEGAGGVGKSTLALEAAQRFGHLAKDGVLPPFRAGEMNAPSFAVALARSLGIARPEAALDEASARDWIGAILKERRCLIILDNALDWKSLRFMLPKRSASIFIVTTRDRDLGKKIRTHFEKTLGVDEIRLSHFSPEESLDLFRELLGADSQAEHEAQYAQIAKELGYLPIALRPVIALIKYSPHYTASQVLDKLQKDGRLSLLRQGQARDDSDERGIDAVFDLASPALTGALREVLECLAICAPGPVPLSFLQRLSGNDRIAENLEDLYTYSWCERREGAHERQYELHQLVRELIFERFGRRFARQMIAAVDSLFLDESVDFNIKDALIPQFNEALELAERSRDDRLIGWIYPLYIYCRFRGHYASYLRLTEIVEQTFAHNQSDLAAALGDRALILTDLGKLDEAMQLHRKQEEIDKALGNRAGLAASYGNQALILQAWGKLDDAMQMHQKEEEIKKALGDRAGLAISYGNQALILRAWGKLDDAMQLLQKTEEIDKALGNRAGLAASYGNQALILHDWGKLDDAMQLHQKAEEIKKALGDRAGLAITWWNQGILYGKRGQKDLQIRLWKDSIETQRSTGIPTADYETALNALLGANSPEPPDNF